MDPQQRYCVNCAARRGNGANPSSRYFAAMSKRARRPMARPPAKSSSSSRAAAVGFFALLPIAVAIGVVVGRADSGGGDEGALLEALRQQDAAAATSAPTTASTAVRKSQESERQPQTAPKAEGKVVAETDNGTVHASPASKRARKRKQRTPNWSKKTPTGRRTTSRPSRTSKT